MQDSSAQSKLVGLTAALTRAWVIAATEAFNAPARQGFLLWLVVLRNTMSRAQQAEVLARRGATHDQHARRQRSRDGVERPLAVGGEEVGHDDAHARLAARSVQRLADGEVRRRQDVHARRRLRERPLHQQPLRRALVQ